MTDNRMRILGISGSLRQASFNCGLLRAAQEAAPDGVNIEICDIGQLPLFNQDVEAQGDPPPVREFKDAIRRADALLIATPEYNYGIPGVLKNAIDWASRPPNDSVLSYKPVAIMGASIGAMGTARAQMALRQAFVFTRSLPLLEPEVYVSRAAERFDADGNLQDEETRKFVARLVASLVDWRHATKGITER